MLEAAYGRVNTKSPGCCGRPDSPFPSSTPRFVLADRGYSGAKLAQTIRRHYYATPIIQTNPAHKKIMVKPASVEESPSWKALYKQRPAVERAYSRLKGQRSLNNITVRGRIKVAAHAYLSLIAMQTRAFRDTTLRRGQPQWLEEPAIPPMLLPHAT